MDSVHTTPGAEGDVGQKLLRHMAERIPAIVYLHDFAEQKNIFVNRRVADVLGYPVEMFEHTRSDDFHKLIHPEDLARLPLWRGRVAALADGEVLDTEYRFQGADGAWHWLHTRDTVFARDAAGAPSQVLGFSWEVTELKRASEALRASEQRFKNAFELVATGMALTALDGRFLRVNRALCELLGHSEADLLHMTFALVTHPDDVPLSWSKGQELIESGAASIHFEKRFVHQSGRTVWGLVSLSLVRADDGQPLYYVAQTQDISELKRSGQVARGQAVALTRTLNSLLVEPDLDKFLGHVLKTIADQFDAHSVGLWLLDHEAMPSLRLAYEDSMVKQADELDHPAVKNPSLARNEDYWRRLVQTRRPIVHEDIATDPDVAAVRAYLMERGVRTVIGVPLLLGDDVIGLVSIRSREPGRFTEMEIELAQALAQQASLALHLTSLAERARQSAILEERNRMAREIHDTLAQGFTGVIVQLEAAEDVLADSGAAARAHLSRARDLARQSLQEARRSVWALRPQALEASTLPAALRQMLANLTRGTTLRVQTQLADARPELAPELASNLLRIGQEAVTNVLKHARAECLTLSLSFDDQHARLEIADDGSGIDLAATAGSGFGLTSMRERAERLGGSLHIVSAPAGGTRIEAIIPLKQPRPAGSNHA